jgi:hypothetical protein
MSQTLACPFCGAMMEAPLHFCQECGRAVTPDDLARAGLKLGARGGGESGSGVSSSRQFALSKRDHSGTRQVRNFMWTMSIVLFLVLGYYSVMKYVLHEHMPGDFDIKMEKLVQGKEVDWSDWKTSNKNPSKNLFPEATSPSAAQPEP